MPHWTEPFLRVGYARGADGPQDYDCWNFGRWVMREHYGRDVPFMPTPPSHGSIAKVMKPWADEFGWRLVDKPQDGDAVFLACLSQPTHVGIWIGDLKRVLHCDTGGPKLHSLAHLQAFQWRICAYYRHAGA